MKAFVVTVNGQRLHTTGVGPNGVLTAIIDWVGGGPHRTPEGELEFHLGGVDGRTGEHVNWSTPQLKVGDLVTVEIIEAEEVDPEGCRFVFNPSGGG